MYQAVVKVANANAPNAAHSVNAEMAIVAQKMQEMATTWCPECSGIGHTRKKCATYKRMLGLTKGLAGPRTIVNAARVDVT